MCFRRIRDKILKYGTKQSISLLRLYIPNKFLLIFKHMSKDFTSNSRRMLHNLQAKYIWDCSHYNKDGLDYICFCLFKYSRRCRIYQLIETVQSCILERQNMIVFILETIYLNMLWIFYHYNLRDKYSYDVLVD